MDFVTILPTHFFPYLNKSTSPLINPTKPEQGRVSKKMKRKIVNIVRKKSGLTQFNNTNDLLIWYNSLPDKQKLHFISFDICSFYPSITKELLRKAIEHASQYTDITEDKKEVLFHTSKSLLYYKGETWKKKGTSLVNITMGGYPGAEKCDLIGLYLLDRMKHLKIKALMFRDDGVGVSSLTKKRTEI